MGALEIVGLEWLGALALFLGFILLIRYLDHRERMAMIDRGLVPPERAGAMGRRGSALLRGGLITGSVGLAVTIGLYTLGYLLPPPFSAVPGKLGPWLLPGLIPLLVGAALIASHYLAPTQAPASETGRDDENNEDDSDAETRSAAGSGPLARIIPWRLFARGATPSRPNARPVAPETDEEDEAASDLERHG